VADARHLFDARALARIPLRAEALTGYRHVIVPGHGPARPLHTGGDGRWNESVWRRPVLYCAEDPETAIAEYCRARAGLIAAADPTGGLGLNRIAFKAMAAHGVGEPLLPRLLYRFELKLDRVADLTAAAKHLRDAGFDPEWLIADDHSPCRALSLIGMHLGWQAIRTPSAARRDTVACCLPTFIDTLASAPRARPIATVRPTVAIADATTYRKGERPAWLLPAT
jgi:RES domain